MIYTWCKMYRSYFYMSILSYIIFPLFSACQLTTSLKIQSKMKLGASLVAQWLQVRLPMQGTRVRALVREDPTCRGAAEPVRHGYWACTLKPVSHNYWAHVLQLLKPAHLEPVLCSGRGHCSKKPAHQKEEWSPDCRNWRKPTCSSETQWSQK